LSEYVYGDTSREMIRSVGRGVSILILLTVLVYFVQKQVRT